ncbi:MAG: hypothetical protein K1000chlam3_00451 [Chlamydiae bacterium]|nr:hypothetical protein [Chlamydiota bacterium]
MIHKNNEIFLPLSILLSIFGGAFCTEFISNRIPWYYTIPAVLFSSHLLFNLIGAYRFGQREKYIRKKALKITEDPEAAKIFYRALYDSNWVTHSSLEKRIFRPIENWVRRFSERDIDHLS